MPSTPSSATPDRPRASRRVALVSIAVAVVLVVGGVLAAVLVTSNADDPSSAKRSSGPQTQLAFVGEGPADVGGTAPDFALPGLDGGTVRLAEYAGRPVVLNFWASWCHPCREEFPLLAKARERHADDGLEVIGVSFRDIASDSRSFASDRGARWPLARDPDRRLAEAWGVNRIPQTFFIAPDGTISAHLFGITSYQDLEAEIARILPGNSR